MGDITKNFSMHEFECRCGCKMPEEVQTNVRKLALQLQFLRTRIGSSIKITSAYRCLSHNRMIGSNDSSQHTLGKAADIQAKEFSPHYVHTFIEYMIGDIMSNEGVTIKGLGKYNSFTHVDIRESVARWNHTT